MGKQFDICVVGACNYDLISYVQRLPMAGETIHGDSFHMGCGGKGANQAVAAAKLGAKVAMVAKLGKDVFGEQIIKNLTAHNINTDKVLFTDKALSGVAPIVVDKKGENAIVIVGGANDRLNASEITAATDIISTAKILLCQLEIPMLLTLKAIELAKNAGVFVLLNLTPVPATGVPEELYTLSDMICVNDIEAEALSGIAINTHEHAKIAGQVLLAKGAKKVLLTLGKEGSMLIARDHCTYVPTKPLIDKDTTGAGDCFIGSFACYHAFGHTEIEAIKNASIIAGLSTQKNGTQSSYPDIKELPAALTPINRLS